MMISATALRCSIGIILGAAVTKSVAGFTISSLYRHRYHGFPLGLARATIDSGTISSNKDGFIKEQIEKHSIEDVQRALSADSDSAASTSEKKPAEPVAAFGRMNDPRPFPLSMVIDQEEIKHALLLAAVNPRSLGVLISGGRGTGELLDL